MDHFGRSVHWRDRRTNKNNVPIVGPPGVSGFNTFVRYLPNSALAIMRFYDLDCAFLITSKETDVNLTKWISRSQTNQARFEVVGDQNKKHLKLHELNFNTRWSVILDGETTLRCPSLSFANNVNSSYGFFCVTFQNKTTNGGEVVLLSSRIEKNSNNVTDLRCTETEIIFQCEKTLKLSNTRPITNG